MSDDELEEENGYHAPHCDALVLHAPGKCEFCDMFPKRQAKRISDGVAFTGEPPTRGGPEKPDPAAQRRPLSVIDRWGGNRARPKKS